MLQEHGPNPATTLLPPTFLSQMSRAKDSNQTRAGHVYLQSVTALVSLGNGRG